ncbi:MAG TPA: class I SAM-dependent methyltransferase [Candidatus Sulfomarinibacteraceae bacterium]|nr:class I SAM-dependent methyltransferase [Candidatus Sulfomarinibacteraceae bacterium]
MTNARPRSDQFHLPPLPSPSSKNLAIRVQPAAERALRQGHPWLYADSIREQSHEGQPGDLAVVFDRRRRFLAVGLYDPLSTIRVRVLQQGQPAPINGDWFQERLASAVARRAPLQEDDGTTGYRLAHGENDGLPGLIVDRYADTLVVKIYTVAWIPHLTQVLPALLSVAPAQRLVLRLSRACAEQRSHLHDLRGGQVLYGPPLDGPVHFYEHGLHFAADVVEGQKTGFFFDHRENRARVEQLAGKKQVLNVFAYTGAFSLYAARGGAPLVVSLDLSQPALAAAEHNFSLNRQLSNVANAEHEMLVGDAFQALHNLRQDGRLFDMVVVDPPSFAQSQAEVERALGAYRKLARRALGVLRRGGILVMASCTSRVTAEQFFTTVHDTASNHGRLLQEIERTGQPLDHPIGFPQGAYLKCLFANAP